MFVLRFGVLVCLGDGLFCDLVVVCACIICVVWRFSFLAWWLCRGAGLCLRVWLNYCLVGVVVTLVAGCVWLSFVFYR